jgi:hypothetical protein
VNTSNPALLQLLLYRHEAELERIQTLQLIDAALSTAKQVIHDKAVESYQDSLRRMRDDGRRANR